MLHAGMIKSEIEKELTGKGNYIQIDYLTRFLKEPLSMDMKKFTHLKLAEIYEKVNMLTEAAKNYDSASTLSITFVEKIKHFMKAAELCVKAADFDRVEEYVKKANAEANSTQRAEIYSTIKNLYKQQGEFFEKNMKKIHAVKAYEKLVQMKISDSEKIELREKLLNLYQQLGKTKEYFLLKGKEIQ